MIAPMFLRLVVFSLTAVVVLLPGLAAGSSGSVGSRDVSDTTTGEGIFVQECNGFDAITGYGITRDYHFVTDPGGDLVFERRQVRFSGALANAETGRAMQYDGEFTRLADYDQGRIEIAGLAVYLELPGSGSLSYVIDRRAGDLTDNPLAVLRAVASHATTTGLCDLLDGPPVADPTSPLNLFAPAPASADDNSLDEGHGASVVRPFAVETEADAPEFCGTQRAGTPC
ncbi:MAG: hypothetical protein ACRDJW_11045 [Thermomicrobiales bacterium]